MDIFEKESYKEVVIKNNYNIIDFLLKEHVEFAILTYTNVIKFNPPIPKEIIEFEKQALFAIAAYTLDSAYLEGKNFIFEAGFGQENFGSTLIVPLEAIYQIVVEDIIVAISYYEPKVINSMEILLNNPENLKLIKRRKSNKK